MKDLKFKIESQEHSKAIQLRLFELGFVWCKNIEDDDSTIANIKNTKHNWLFWNNLGPYSETSGINCFYDDKLARHKECVLTTLDDLYRPMISTWDYSLSSQNIWCSFDSGTVEALTREEARIMAAEILRDNFNLVNRTLGKCGMSGMTFDFDTTEIEIAKA